MSESDEAQKLTDAVQKLRIAYEQYFAGVERVEPVKERDRVKKELRRLMGVRSNNTAYKFKLQSTQATLVTYENHWDRIVRQIEEGTFKRDKLKAQKHLQSMRDVTNEIELIEEPVAPAAPDPIRLLHEAFVAARAQTGEKAVSFEAIAETVRKQTAAVKAKMNCERVEFKVAIKDGKAVLKAIPK